MEDSFISKSLVEIKKFMLDLGIAEDKVNATTRKAALKAIYEDWKAEQTPLEQEKITVEENYTQEDGAEYFKEVVMEDELSRIDDISFYNSNNGSTMTNEKPVFMAAPLYSDPEWSDYVVSQLAPDEIDTNGYPLMHGLRRLAEHLLGDVITSKHTKLDVVHINGDPTVICEYIISIAWRGSQVYIREDGRYETQIRTFGGVADASSKNVDDGFNGIFQSYLSTIAENRAEARALRKALRLNTVSKEEICNKNQKEFASDKISGIQKSYFVGACKFNGWNSEAICQGIFGKPLDDLSHKDGVELIKQLREFVVSKDIPSEYLA